MQSSYAPMFPVTLTGIKYDLPDAEIYFVENLFDTITADGLFERLKSDIEWRQDEIKIYGKTIMQPRLTAFYGDPTKSYKYSNLEMKPVGWTDDLLLIKQRLDAISGVAFTSVLLNYYRDGKDSMGWHRDNEKELGPNPVIASVSFGETRPFQLRHKYKKEFSKVEIPLSHGSLLLMKGTTQHFWEHQIPKTSKPIGGRINLTFRVIV